MKYTFYCEKPGDRFARDIEYKTHAGLANRIKKYEAKGYSVTVNYNSRWFVKHIYQDGKFLD